MRIIVPRDKGSKEKVLGIKTLEVHYKNTSFSILNDLIVGVFINTQSPTFHRRTKHRVSRSYYRNFPNLSSYSIYEQEKFIMNQLSLSMRNRLQPFHFFTLMAISDETPINNLHIRTRKEKKKNSLKSLLMST